MSHPGDLQRNRRSQVSAWVPDWVPDLFWGDHRDTSIRDVRAVSWTIRMTTDKTGGVQVRIGKRSAGVGVTFLLLVGLGWGVCSGADITAHRGASFEAPENTLAAFRLAWERGADAIEGDFYLTADRKIVCLHDRTLERTGGANLAVAQSTLSELRELDVGSWKGASWAGERIPTLGEVLETVPGDGKRIFIELKSGPEIVGALKEVLAASGLAPEQVRIISFQEDVLTACRRELPTFRTSWLSGYKEDASGTLRPTAGEVIETLRSIGTDGFGTASDRDVVDAGFVKTLRKGGVHDIHVWTVNEPEQAMYFNGLGVDGITTDRPALIRRALQPGPGAIQRPSGHGPD